MRLSDRIRAWLWLGPRVETTPATLTRGRVDHVIILDGTLSSLAPGRETNAGLLYKLLSEVAGRHRLSLRYEAGVQWDSWTNTRDVIEGRGINRQIRRAYGFLASRYRPGDRIYLFGYSRGAYAVRSLAGFIGAVGLLRAEKATVRNIRLLYRGYQTGRMSPVLAGFSERHCHPEAEIEMVGVWDTVKALGLRAPVIWRWADAAHEFHDHHLNRHVKRGYHALALDETREAFAPVMWATDPDWCGEMEQVWFRGTHGDIGGQLGGYDAARPLANIPLVWMLERAAACGLPLPQGGAARFPLDAGAPSVGTWRGWGKFFVARRRRVPLRDPSEALHSSVAGAQAGVAV